MTSRTALGLWLTLACLYLLVGSREPPWTDARQLHEVAESLVERGSIAVPTPTNLARDGRYYAFHPLVPSLIHLPGAVLARALVAVAPRDEWNIRAMTSHLGPALVGALCCLLFAQLCVQLRVAPRTASLMALLLGCATMVAIYARVAWSEIAQTAAFTGSFLWLLRLAAAPGRRPALWLGVWLGLLVNTKAVFLLALPGVALFAGVPLARAHGRGAVLRAAGWVASGALPFALLFLWYNHARTGSAFSTGYALPGEAGRAYDESLLTGLYGLFLSLGKGAFFYNPPLVAAALALPHALRTRPRAWLVALALTAGPVVLLHAKSSFWSGDWCWGPRYVLFLVPVALLPVAFALDDALTARRRLALAAGGAVLAAGVAVQALGGAYYWDHFIRIGQEARDAWLGEPDRRGAIVADRGNACDPCYEDLYQRHWLPAFQPIEGQLWLLRHRAGSSTRDSWQAAAADAPWRRYTTLELDISRSYGRVRMDWWFYEFHGHLRALGLALLALLVAGVGGSAVFWWRTARAAAPASRASDGASPP